MAETKIEWTSYRRPDGSNVPGYTFNPWIGCSKVSAGCKNCYAETETFARVQRSKGRELWGVSADRHITSDANWAKPRSWNREAEQAGERRRVFCASMADVFEEHPAIMPGWRARLGQIILDTSHLDWLIPTKRPENACRMLPDFWINFSEPFGMPPNVWIGTSVENQEMADKRIPELLKIPARVKFLSCEPLLGPIDLSRWMDEGGEPINSADYYPDALPGVYDPMLRSHITEPFSEIDWVIAGGESGPSARPTHPEWVRNLRDQCSEAGVPFHFKQWGTWFPRDQWEDNPYLVLPDDDEAYTNSDHTLVFRDGPDYYPVHKVGKKAAGRILDGRTWDEYPDSVLCSQHGYDNCPACTGERMEGV